MKKGLFEVVLIHKESTIVFKEHKKGEVVYAEVEPEVEYFIRVSSEAEDPVFVDIEVDGVPIEKGRKIVNHEVIGFRKFGGGTYVEKAFYFDTANYDKKAGTSMNPYLYWTGNVQVIFHGDPKYNYATCVLSTSPVLSTKVESPNDISSSDEDSKHVLKDSAKIIYRPRKNKILFRKNDDISGKIGYSENNFSEMKGVKSGCGKTTINTGHTKKKKKTQKPQNVTYLDLPQIGWFNLNYCSTLGLIYADILPKPKDWVWAEARYRSLYGKKEKEKKIEKIQFDEIKIPGVHDKPGFTHEVLCCDLTRYLD